MDIPEVMQVTLDDPSLRHWNGAIRHRYAMYMKKKAELASSEGSLENFAKGYETFGIHTTSSGMIYREWAPGAKALSLVSYYTVWRLQQLE